MPTHPFFFWEKQKRCDIFAKFKSGNICDFCSKASILWVKSHIMWYLRFCDRTQSAVEELMEKNWQHSWLRKLRITDSSNGVNGLKWNSLTPVIFFVFLLFVWCFCFFLISPLQRNGGLFGNHVNYVGGDQRGASHPTTVTQRPLQILPFSCSASVALSRRLSNNDRDRETEMKSSPIHYNHHCSPRLYDHPHCNSTSRQSPVPSNANLNNANVPSLLSTTTGRRQNSLHRSRPSSARNGSSYSKSVHNKLWKSHSTRSVNRRQNGFLLFQL